MNNQISLVIFDLDGVLIDSRDLHYSTLNQALSEINHDYIISYKDHLTKFDGLSTYKKLEILSKNNNLPIELHEKIWNRKQELTSSFLDKTVTKDDKLIDILTFLKHNNIKLYVASNSIKKTVEIVLSRLGIINLLDGYLSNEDVSTSKPHPEIFMQCMIKEKVLPINTLILEDSYIGRNAAIMSGATLCPINNPNDVTLDKIINYMNNNTTNIKWKDDNMNVLIPMAGAGSRFKTAGYVFPKPLIEVNNKPMIQLVIDNLNIEANYIFIVQKEHLDTYNLSTFLNFLSPNCKIVIAEKLTAGACASTLLAENYINTENPLLIVNSDQLIEWESGEFYHSINSPNIDGSILTFNSTHPKWSYIKCNEYGNVIELKEKDVISNDATVGIYYWKKGSDYVKYAKKMIADNIRVNNEFYVAPVYTGAIQDGKIIKTFKVKKMWGLGTPEDLNYFNSFAENRKIFK